MADSTEKIQMYREMLKLDPSSRVFELLAEGLCASGEWEELEKVCREGIRFHPERMRPRVLHAVALMEMGDMKGSESILLELHGEMCKNSIIYKLLSALASNSGNVTHAREFSCLYEAFENTETPPERKVEGREPGYRTKPISPEQFELILSKLAERMESSMSAPENLPGVFEKIERDFLKQTILAELEVSA